MRNRLASLAVPVLAAAAFSAPLFAQTPPGSSATAPASGDPAAAVPPSGVEAPRAADPAPPPGAMQDANAIAGRAHLDAAVSFLRALSHTTRKGEPGAQAWSDLHAVSADKVPLTLAGQHHDLDVAGKSSPVKVLGFSAISTMRDGKNISGVQVGMLDVKVGADEHKGAAKIAMVKSDGAWKVQSIDIQ